MLFQCREIVSGQKSTQWNRVRQKSFGVLKQAWRIIPEDYLKILQEGNSGCIEE